MNVFLTTVFPTAHSITLRTYNPLTFPPFGSFLTDSKKSDIFFSMLKQNFLIFELIFDNSFSIDFIAQLILYKYLVLFRSVEQNENQKPFQLPT